MKFDSFFSININLIIYTCIQNVVVFFIDLKLSVMIPLVCWNFSQYHMMHIFESIPWLTVLGIVAKCSTNGQENEVFIYL